MKVVSVEDTSTIIVKRSFDSTIGAVHASGAKVSELSTADDALIELGDDFGFNEFMTEFDDGLVYSPTKQQDVLNP